MQNQKKQTHFEGMGVPSPWRSGGGLSSFRYKQWLKNTNFDIFVQCHTYFMYLHQVMDLFHDTSGGGGGGVESFFFLKIKQDLYF